MGSFQLNSANEIIAPLFLLIPLLLLLL